ncbi:hypothetical protein [Variovorax sp. E3]|uniref:hypothetical protein n=1 Tax=Variovorax sp. E3 TaxID=1914993 RepID=UPI0018DDCF53|nr:hypothetical protein [Variovorax sp. E3]
MLALFTACNCASACQRIIQITLTFADGSADLDRTQIARLAGWIGNANAMFAKYTSAGVEAGATAKPPERTPKEAMQLARMRADNVALALKTLFPAPLDVEKFAHSYREKKSSDVDVNDFAAIQIYPDLKTSRLPDCNPGLRTAWSVNASSIQRTVA